MDWLKNLRQAKIEEPQAPASQLPESSSKPANALEQIVHDASPVLVELKKTEDQLEQDALQTMAYLEAARQEKGNFCLTLGKGNKRAILLVAPVEGIKAEDLVKRETDYTYAVTRTDYILLTSEGLRRMSFSQADPSPLYTGEKLKTRNDQEALKEKKFKGIVDQLVKKGEVNLEYSMYQEWPVPDGSIDVNLSIGIPGSKLDSDKFSVNTGRYRKNDFANCGVSGVVIDDVTPVQALKDSLNSVQNPLKARVSEAQAQIRSIRAVGQGLK